MSNKHLAIYRSDHHAGSEAALAILDHLEASHGAGPAGELARRLRPEFKEERVQLQKLLDKLGATTSVPRRVVGWLSEKGLELKIYVDDPADGPLHLLESVEMLGLGVHGKLGLWIALQHYQQSIPVLQTVEYAPLIAQAEAQRVLIESVRLDEAGPGVQGRRDHLATANG